MFYTKREFIRGCIYTWGGLLCASLCPGGLSIASGKFKADDPHLKEAYFYQKLDDKLVQCKTCPNQCVIGLDERGACGTKVNIKGSLFSISYGNPCSIHVDPIEKKPLLHFYPGSTAFSLAVAGCNFHCLNCQNWEISQTTPDKTRNMEASPDEIVKTAKKNQCKSIAYTYSEATTFYEYMVDISKKARDENIKNVWVSNGYMSQEALHKLCDTIDAGSINLKSFSDDIYMKLNGGHLEPVLNTLKTLHTRRIWLEIINLVIPTYTDDIEMIKKMCGWIVKNLGPDYPLHFSRFFPKYKLLRLPPTPVEVLHKAQDTAQSEGLHYVYIGNVPQLGDNVICPNCKNIVIKRKGYSLHSINIKDGVCGFCNNPISGRWA
ncbi:MAG: AmmeMemoRadiSam system radical SAM enzyme [bacterium]